jgi:hypothetical protein
MTSKTGRGIVPLCALVLAGAAGCQAAPAATDEQPGVHEASGVERAQSGVLVASLTLEEGHEVRFYEAAPGLLSASESGRIDVHVPAIKEEMKGQSFVEIYRALAPSAAIPQALLDAESRRVQARAEPRFSVLPADVEGFGRGPSFYDSYQQAWFKSTFCNGASKCVQGWDWADSGWDYADYWQTTSMVGSEGQSAAPFNGYYWKCSGSSCWWQPFFTDYVSPGYWDQRTTSNSSNFYFKSNLSGAGGGTQVSLSVQLRYDCAFCNDNSCQCGYVTRDTLCSGHWGVNYSVGCTVQQ